MTSNWLALSRICESDPDSSAASTATSQEDKHYIHPYVGYIISVSCSCIINTNTIYKLILLVSMHDMIWIHCVAQEENSKPDDLSSIHVDETGRSLSILYCELKI